MYLPQNLSLCDPHVFNWVGASGRRYEFAVSRPAASWLDQAAVFILVRRKGEETTVLYVGHACSLHQRFGLASDRCPEIWRRALAAGMTHVHLRFEACSERERLAEVRDLKAGLKPALEEIRVPAWNQHDRDRHDRNQPDRDQPNRDQPDRDPPRLQQARRPVEAEVPAASADDVLVPFRARLKPTRHRDPNIDAEAIEADALPANLPLGHAFELPRLLRADPAREATTDEDLSSEDGGAVVTWQEERAGAMEVTGEPLPEVIPLPEPVASESESVDDPQVEVASIESPHRPSVADDQPAAVEAPEVSDYPPVPAPSHRQSGLLSRLMGAAAARYRHWRNAAGKESATEAPTATELPELKPSQLPQTTGSLEPSASLDQPVVPAQSVSLEQSAVPVQSVSAGERASEEGGPAPDAGEDRSGQSVSAGVAAEAANDVVSLEQPEPVAASGSQIEERPVAILAVSEDRPVMAEAAASPAAEPAAVAAPARASSDAVKRELGMEPAAPLVLFAGALSYDAGADIFAEALITVSSGDSSAQFMFVGEGPQRGQLQDRVQWAGVGGRCHFMGDVPSERFEQLLDACSFVVIPARTPQGEELARLALIFGKPAIVTHQSGIQCVEHGKSGLITYDNPGSFVWGIRELLGPLGAKLGGLRAVAA